MYELLEGLEGGAMNIGDVRVHGEDVPTLDTHLLCILESKEQAELKLNRRIVCPEEPTDVHAETNSHEQLWDRRCCSSDAQIKLASQLCIITGNKQMWNQVCAK